MHRRGPLRWPTLTTSASAWMTGAAPGASSRSATAGLCACRSRMGEEQHVLRAAAAGPAAAGAGLPPAVHARVLQLACEVMAESSKAVVVLSADQGRDFLCEFLRHLGRDAVPGFNVARGRDRPDCNAATNADGSVFRIAVLDPPICVRAKGT